MIALRASAEFARIEGDFDAAEQFAAESIAAAKAAADRVGEMQGVGTLANIALMRRDYPRADTLMEQVASLAHEIGDDHALAVTVGNRAYLALQLGDFEAALALAQETLVLGRNMGDRATVVTAALNVGLAAHALGKQQEARAALVDALEPARAAGHRTHVVYGLIVAAAVVARNDPATARYLLAAAQRAQKDLAIELDPVERDLLAAVESQLGRRHPSNEPMTGEVDLILDSAATRALESLRRPGVAPHCD